MACHDVYSSRLREARLKAFGFDTYQSAGKCAEPVWCELQDLLHGLVPEDVAGKMVLHKTMSKLKPKVSIVAEQIGGSWEDCFLRSRRAWPATEELHPCVRQEWQASLVGVIALFLTWAHHRHDMADRKQAAAFATGFFDKVLDDRVFASIGGGQVPNAVLSECGLQSHRVAGACCHFADLLEFEMTIGGTVGQSVWALLSYLYARQAACRTIAARLDHRPGLGEAVRWWHQQGRGHECLEARGVARGRQGVQAQG